MSGFQTKQLLLVVRVLPTEAWSSPRMIWETLENFDLKRKVLMFLMASKMSSIIFGYTLLSSSRAMYDQYDDDESIWVR